MGRNGSNGAASRNPRPAALAAVGAALALLAAFPAPARAELERHPTQVGTAIDVGQVVKGDFGEVTGDGQVLTRTGVYLTESGTYNRRLSIQLTVGGLFWFPMPEDAQFQRRIVRFGPGVGQAQAVYAFGDPEHPSAKLQFGLFPHKYNPDAKNLGEYLYRSGTYPGYITTGGWSYMNSAAYMAQGARLTVPTLDGLVVHDVTLFMERDIEPTHDISPSYMVTIAPGRAFEFGAGLVWAHGLPLKPDSILTPAKRENAYVKATGKPLTAEDVQKPGYASNDTVIVPEGDARIDQPVPGRVNVKYVTAAGNGTPKDRVGYYTFKGFKAMLRASLNLGSLIGSEAIGPDGFKLYAEAALLGIENQPFYYERRAERMPVMMGVNIPTFGLLDMLSVEAEYHKSRFANTIDAPFEHQLPLPISFGEDWAAYQADSSAFKRDDWHWSVYARRRVMEGVTVFAQAASDHLRHIDEAVKPTAIPTTRRPQDWYYLVRLEFGI